MPERDKINEEPMSLEAAEKELARLRAMTEVYSCGPRTTSPQMKRMIEEATRQAQPASHD